MTNKSIQARIQWQHFETPPRGQIENEQDDNLSIQGQIDPEETNECKKVHPSYEDAILSVNITEKSINNFQNQVMVIKVHENLRTILKQS